MSGTRNIYYSLLTCAAVALGLTPAAADAATAGDIPLTQVLNTSPLWADSVSYHECIVVNITTGAVTVSGELISSNGTMVNSAGAISIPAGTAYWLSDANGSGGSTYMGFLRCRFSTNASAGAIRANETTFAVLPSGNLHIYAVSEAR